MGESVVQKFQELGARYGFRVSYSKGCYQLCAKNTDGHWTAWLSYAPAENRISLRGHTDHLNLWLHETRPDLTPERCLRFVQELNKVFGLSEEDVFSVRDLIDPEDWQEIADVNDAYTDPRYTDKPMRSLNKTITNAERKIVPAPPEKTNWEPER